MNDCILTTVDYYLILIKYSLYSFFTLNHRSYSIVVKSFYVTIPQIDTVLCPTPL